jgi:hypothetical protein
MSGLTKIPLELINPGNGSANDQLLYNGRNLELQSPDDQGLDTQLVSGDYDIETGTLSLVKADRSTVLIRGLLTKSSIGVGATGPTGPAGKAGVNGRNGRDGRRGDTGCQGPKGDPGPAGNTGPAGQNGGFGMTGPRGEPGPPGPTGPAGNDGLSPKFASTLTDGFEHYAGKSLKCWGRFTDASSVMFQRIVFPQAFGVDKSRAIFLQFIDPASPLKNAVKIDRLNRGNAELSIDPTKLPQVSDGAGGTQPATVSGWDFYWFVVGSDTP